MSAAAPMSPTVRIEIIGDRVGKIDLLSIDVDGTRVAGVRERQLGGALPGFLMSLLLVAGFLWLGVSYFRETEQTFSDFI
jgi:hypothetical protein